MSDPSSSQSQSGSAIERSLLDSTGSRDADAQFEKVDGLWFEDGNVVIKAGDRAFKLYKHFLSSRSIVFQDLFSLPQPTNATDAETLAGCPLVRLPDDSYDVETFFRAIFDSNFFLPPPTATTLKIAVAVLKLGHKYEVDYLRLRALLHLETRFPFALSDFLKVHSDNSQKTIVGNFSNASRFVLVDAARACGAPWILPALFYRTIQTNTVESIYAGVHGIKMMEENRLACLQGYHPQMSSLGTVLRFLYSDLRSHPCESPVKCNAQRLALLDGFESSKQLGDKLSHKWAANPLQSWDRYDARSKEGLCKACADSCESQFRAARQEFWDNLPKLYGLPPWEDLLQLRSEAMNVSTANTSS